MTEKFRESAGNKWEQKYTGKLFLIEENTQKGFERAVRPPGVRLIIKNKEGKILLTKEHRAEQGGYDFRLPGGKVCDDIESYLKIRDDQNALMEAVMKAAQTEAKQESGVAVIDNLELLKLSSNGATVEWDLYYMTGDVAEIGEQELHGDEALYGIERNFYTKEEVLNMLKTGQIKEDRSVAVLFTELLK